MENQCKTRDSSTPLLSLPDGYNGHMALFHPEPVGRDGNLVKLQCADDGQSHCIRWVHIDDFNRAKLAARHRGRKPPLDCPDDVMAPHCNEG